MFAKHNIDMYSAVVRGSVIGTVNAKQDRISAAVIPNIPTPASASAVTGTSITAAGTGYLNPANVVFTPNAGTAQIVCTSLKAVSAAVSAQGTSGFAINDTITLANGVVLTVTAVSSGKPTTANVTTAGAFTGQVATNPVLQTATSGAGVGITSWTLAYGLNAVAIKESGNGSNPTWTVSTVNSDPGTGATLTTTQGGNSNAIFVCVASNGIPAVCVATFDTNFSCNGYVALKGAGFVTFALVPIGATTLAAGTLDALILA